MIKTKIVSNPCDNIRRLAIFEAAGNGNNFSILLVHGLWDNGKSLYKFGRFFAKEGNISAFVPTLRCDTPNIGHEEIADDLFLFLQKYRFPQKQLIILAHSGGGAFALKLVSRFIAYERIPYALVLVNSSPVSGIPFETSPEFAKAMISSRCGRNIFRRRAFKPAREVFDKFLFHNIPEENRPSYGRIPLGSGKIMLEFLAGSGSGLTRTFARINLLSEGIKISDTSVQCPILAIGSERDRVVRPRVARALGHKFLFALLKTKERVKIYKNFGHLLPIEPGWEVVAQDILDWLKNL